MIKQNILFQLFFLLIGLKLGAQLVPGYQGKKNIGSYQLNISPALSGPNYLNRVGFLGKNDYLLANSAVLPFNLSHSFKIEHVFGRKFSMSANYSIEASKTYVNFDQAIVDPVYGGSRNMSFRDVKINVFGNFFTGSLIFYGKRALAPFGKYFKIDFSYVSLVSSYVDPEISPLPLNSLSTDYKFSTKDIHYSLNTFGLGCSFGTNRIYYKRLVINRGVSLFLINKGGNYIEDSKGMIPAMFKRMRLRDLTSFYISAGYLF